VITQNVRFTVITKYWRHLQNCSIKLRLFPRTSLPTVTQKRRAFCAVPNRNFVYYMSLNFSFLRPYCGSDSSRRHVQRVVDTVAIAQDFLCQLVPSAVSTIPPTIHIHLLPTISIFLGRLK
jgi:hypothetical protein